MTQREPWIGLVEAAVGEPRPADVSGDIAGAFLTFVCVCAGAQEYQRAAAEHVASSGWTLAAVQDVEPVPLRLKQGRPARDVLKVIRSVAQDGVSRSSLWHLFPYEDDSQQVPPHEPAAGTSVSTMPYEDENDVNATDAMLAEAVGRIADTDSSLTGATPTKWLLITEHARPGLGHTLSVFRSDEQPPWDSLGLLRFATVQEESRALYGGHDDEDDGDDDE